MMLRRILVIALLLSALIPVVSQAGVIGTEAFGGAGDLGANWTVVTGLEMPQQVSGVGQPKTANVSAHAIRTAETYPTDHYAQATIVAAAGNLDVPGVTLRGTTAARTQYECTVFGPLGATTTLKIHRYNAGAGTQLATTAADQVIAANDVLKCTIVGYIITLYINGTVRLGPYDDSASGSKIASGNPGVNIFVATAHALTAAKVDNWEAGDMVPASSSLGFLEVDE